MSTTVTVRPTSTLRTGWTLTGGGGTLHNTLADNSDSTYARGNDETGKIRFGPAILPAGAFGQYVTLRLRVRRGSGTVVVLARLNGGPTIRFTPPTGSGWATQSSAAQIGVSDLDKGVTLSLDDFSGPGTVDVAEAFLDVVYIARPAVNVISPSGTTDVTQPIVEWDTSGDFPQSRYQVKIFTQAQYDAVGFDPAASTPLYDSGVQSGAADSHVPRAINLTNGGTYRFYVRAAQQVGSTTQWSLWAFSTATVVAIPPPVPTIEPEPDDALARIKLTVTDSTISGDPPDEDGGIIILVEHDASSWQYVTVERTVDGATWKRVRGANHAPVFGSVFTTYDYESCNGQQVQYRARAIGTNGGQDVASDWSPLTAPVAWESPETWLKSPLEPAVNTTVRINELPTLKRRNPQGKFDVPDRSDPIVVQSKRKLVEGTVTFVTLTGELNPLLALLDRAEVLLLQTPARDGWGCRYITIEDTDENRIVRRSTPPERLVVCPFTEVLAPPSEPGQTVTFGYTYDDIAARYATYDDAAEVVSYNALAGVT